jgi:nucleoid DNA-binding protein
LRPKKAKTFIPEVANELSLPNELVSDIIQHYWSEVRSSLSNLKHSRVHLSNLGDFVIKHWKVEEKMERLKLWEEKHMLAGNSKIIQRFKVAESLYMLTQLRKIMLEEQQRKDFIKLHKTKTNESKE